MFAQDTCGHPQAHAPKWPFFPPPKNPTRVLQREKNPPKGERERGDAQHPFPAEKPLNAPPKISLSTRGLGLCVRTHRGPSFWGWDLLSSQIWGLF